MENGKLKIMIVDRDQTYARELENFIHIKLDEKIPGVDLGFTILHTPQEGIMKLAENSHNIVIADVYFGQTYDGLKFVEAALGLLDQRISSKILWMIMGDEANLDGEKKATELGALFVSKENPELLIVMIEAFLRKNN